MRRAGTPGEFPVLPLSAIHAAAATVGGFPLLAVLIYVADEHRAAHASVGRQALAGEGETIERSEDACSYTSVMADEDTVLEEAMDNLKEAGQRIRATQSLMRAQGMTDGENHRDLLTRLCTALAMTGAAYLEARRRRDL